MTRVKSGSHNSAQSDIVKLRGPIAASHRIGSVRRTELPGCRVCFTRDPNARDAEREKNFKP